LGDTREIPSASLRAGSSLRLKNSSVQDHAVEAMNEAGKFTHAFLARGAKTIPSDDD
jgi:hypothetical protein